MEPFLPVTFTPSPDLPEPATAFRDWRVTREGLISPRTGTVWSTRTIAAKCHPRTAEELAQSPHLAPGRDCSCGIHAYFRPNLETSKIDFRGVTGIVSVWGQVEVHSGGVRAEYARVEALGVYSRWTRRQKAAVFAIADRLDVDVVDLHDLEQAAARYGSPFPATLRPGRAPAARGQRRAERLPHSVVIYGG